MAAMLKAGAEQATNDDFPDAVDDLPLGEAEPDVLENKPSERAWLRKKHECVLKESAKRVRTESTR